MTTPGATFAHPITLNIYNVDSLGQPGAIVLTKSQTFAIPYRPSADLTCSTPTAWRDAGSNCYNGFAHTITFDLSASLTSLPDNLIWAVAFNTSGYGSTPLGYSTTCFLDPDGSGCGYDSLNVGVQSFTGQPSAGMDVDDAGAVLDSDTAAQYCDGGTAGTGELRTDTPCWTGYRPLATIRTLDQLGPCAVSVAGTNPVTYTLLADCITDETIMVPQNSGGSTFDGAGFTITGVDPTDGHFVGAVIQAAPGASAITVKDLTVTVSALAEVCDAGADRLAGIRFDGVGGSITDNNVTGIKQATNSGCQEGNGIDVRNEPFTTAGPDKSVTISGNTVTDYQKTGVLVSGSVVATITDNTITGAGPIDYIGQNGIQVSYGASAKLVANDVSGNDYTPAKVTACGLLIYKAGGVSGATKSGISYIRADNNFFNNETNICNFGKGGGFTPAS